MRSSHLVNDGLRRCSTLKKPPNTSNLGFTTPHLAIRNTALIGWRAIESPRDSYIRAMSNLERAKYKDSEGRIELVLVVPSGTRSTASGSTKRSEGRYLQVSYKCQSSTSRSSRSTSSNPQDGKIQDSAAGRIDTAKAIKAET